MLCTNDKGSTIVCASDTSLAVFSTKDGAVLSEMNLSASVLAMHAAFGYLAIGTNDKRLHLYQMSDYSLVASIDVLKRVASLVVAEVEESIYVLVADKFAEVFAYPVSNNMTSRSFLLQHPTSSITAMRASPSLGKLFTADQDEKIRISNFPAAHVVSNYCLGHTSVVSSIDVLLPNSDDASCAVLLSGGGDATLRSWNPETGVLLDVILFDTTLNIKEVKEVKEVEEEEEEEDVEEESEGSKAEPSEPGVVVASVTCSKHDRSVTFVVICAGKSKVFRATVDANGKMSVAVAGVTLSPPLSSSSSSNVPREVEGVLKGTVIGISLVDGNTHAAYASEEGKLAWSHSSSSSALASALDVWSLTAPMLAARGERVRASAPRGERVRERAEKEAEEQRQQRKKARTEEK